MTAITTIRSTLLRIAAVASLALWWGGFTFYAARVVPIGNEMLHSKLRQGAITQKVTGELNLLAMVAFAAVGASMLSSKPRTPRFAWSCLAIAIISTAALFLVRNKLNGMFDPAARDLVDPRGFHHLHEVYLTIATVQWGAASLLLIVLQLATKSSPSGEEARQSA